MKRGITTGVSNSVIDEAYQTAKDAGAEGGKILGAGGGGFLMFLAPPDKHDAIRHALGRLRETRFQFFAQGSHILYWFTD
jgi:D-glycero-alpha-D-manno-heptose-7-phosphate kinase